MEKIKTLDVAAQIVELLTPLDSNERQRVIKASLLLLGESETNIGGEKVRVNGEMDEHIKEFPRAVQIWMKQNNMDIEQLEQVFLLTDGKAEIIASDVPGGDSKNKTLNAYVLQGLSNLISTGEANFDDKSARKLCKDLGCYNEGNHSTYLASKENKFAGSKDSGWKLTGPGLKYSAELVKQIIGIK